MYDAFFAREFSYKIIYVKCFYALNTTIMNFIDISVHVLTLPYAICNTLFVHRRAIV